ncbi:PhaM family polyhydroxyalkanoate granule multifunctional regulatory protein [Pararobbsia alpina]|uniref:Uncharacterized protein n=1 Tax=Pararobbsia alpina TaxID=621374 RepID=A0A6S7B5K1_9BURK|nr:PhaM family polyhydroxyalkanoate granule multifunctional regulatory protein [Pararobbsia alpina]CAB3788816.1 hypothetical protein LMG28138_02685 [Pararobbsia alpina]
MTESAGTPFGYDMFEKMWGMFREGPFAAQFAAPFSMPGMGGTPSLSAMSNLVAPLTNVEELDKRIEEMRAVEQWLKLNLNMLQSAIQALEVQRSTLATLRAFGAFAQSSVAAAAEAGAAVTREGTRAAESAADTARQAAASRTPTRAPAGEAGREGGQSGTSSPPAPQAPASDPAAMSAAFDPNGWWNLLQSQFNQIAGLAAASAAAGMPAAATAAGNMSGANVQDAAKTGTGGKTTDAGGGRTRPGSKSASADGDGAARATSKPPAKARAKPVARSTTKPPKAAMRAADKASLSVPLVSKSTRPLK